MWFLWLLLDIVKMIGIYIAIAIVDGAYRNWHRHTYGPSRKDFAKAVALVARFIDHHNRIKPQEPITSIKISRNGVYPMGPGGEIKVTETSP